MLRLIHGVFGNLMCYEYLRIDWFDKEAWLKMNCQHITSNKLCRKPHVSNEYTNFYQYSTSKCFSELIKAINSGIEQQIVVSQHWLEQQIQEYVVTKISHTSVTVKW